MRARSTLSSSIETGSSVELARFVRTRKWRENVRLACCAYRPCNPGVWNLLEGAWTVKPPSCLITGVGFTRGRLPRPQAPWPHLTSGALNETELQGNL